MDTVKRGVRNAFRNSIRTFSIVIILGLSIGLALAMLVARASVETKIESVKSSIGNTITVTPAGAQGFQGGGEPLTTAQLAKVAALANVTNVTNTLSDRLTTDNTNLVAAIEAGSLGARGAANSGVGFMQAPPDGGPSTTMTDPSNTQTVMRTFTPPVMITGSNDVTTVSVYGGDSVTYTSGEAFDPSSTETVAVVGKALAEKNSLKVGSTFTAYGATFTVVGIYDTGNTFSNAGVIVPLATLQKLSEQADSITSSVVTVNSVDNLDNTVSAIKASLGSTADVVSAEETAKLAVEPLESVKTIATFSLIVAVVAGAVIILLTMVMIVRERRREIGVLKAIGASNVRVVTQFMAEAVTLTMLGLIAGLIIGVAAATPLTNTLVSNSTSSSQQTNGPNIMRRGGPVGPRSASNTVVNSARDVKASVGTEVVFYGIATAFIIAIIGSAIPAFLISKVRPAEVMRAE